MDSASKGVACELSELKGKDFISSADLTSEQIKALFALAIQLKIENRRIDLGNRVLGLIFSKASTRTRVSFQVAMARLGGQIVDLGLQATQIGRGEPIKDTARVLSRYCDALAIRTYSHQDLVDYSNWASIPVVNALTDLEHPCQALADFLTIQESFGSLKGLTLSYIGDGNNVANSLILCGALLGVNVRVASPIGFEPDPDIVSKARSASSFGSTIQISNDPESTIKGANAIYTDVWASMGQEEEQCQREIAFKGFTVDNNLFSQADPEAIILHCLPAHRGEEITDELMESTASKIFEQAENRLHIQQALLASLLGGL
ncbi:MULTISPECIES: ornithine carbamoyltransferase [Prochlorococcus]|uniref:ornithine carbamoyltransferase n=1 Tax=Prochlorococcus TaxID=1218 RepID=UPI000533A2A6|nr:MULTISPECIES: ornithine carbamoyltransferase [Prochlorococcus]KGG12028.1 Ornithine carbamoyltransferase [Prochlorococcus sp. MIT 0601]